ASACSKGETMMTNLRMTFLSKTVSLVVAAMVAGMTPARSAPADAPASAAGGGRQQTPGYYRKKMGEFRLPSLSDGNAPRDLSKIMSKPDEVRAAFAASHEALPVQISINCFLIDTGTHRILVDTGAGELFGQLSGQLVENLRAAGYQPDDIDIILLTHIHG